uniref:Uncharacterized protein LOC114341776 n=1 Tax=Diabrotica virgifera virgifera TaxID=50390 RepID=A0A6P7GX41_DIAVI
MANYLGTRQLENNNDDFLISNLSNFSVGHLNVRSLNTGFDEFTNYMMELDIDMLGLTETWLNSDMPSFTYRLPGYRFVRKDRLARGGGVALYIKNNIKFSLINLNFPFFEHIAIEFTVKNINYILINIYRPPSVSESVFLDQFEDLLGYVTVAHKNIIIVGDLNINFLSNTTYPNRLKNLLQTLQFDQHIKEPTRFNFTNNTSSLIDIIITSQNIQCIKSGSLAISQCVTDHNLVYTILNLPKITCHKKTVTYRDYSNIIDDLLMEEGRMLDWQQLFVTDSIEEKVEIFTSHINKILNKHAPVKILNKHAPVKTRKISEKPYLPWITTNIKQLIKLRDKAHKKYMRTKTEGSLQYYRQLRNFTKHAIIREKITFFNTVGQSKGKEFWKTAKKLNLTYNENQLYIPDNLNNATNIHNFF